MSGPLTEKDGKVSARPATPNRETAAKGEKVWVPCYRDIILILDGPTMYYATALMWVGHLFTFLLITPSLGITHFIPKFKRKWNDTSL